MQGKSDKVHEHPHSLCEPCKKSYRANILTGIGRDFWRDFRKALSFFLEAGRGQCFLFVVRLLRIFEFFLSNFCAKWIFIFIYFLFTSCSSLAWGQFHQIKHSNFQTFHFPLDNCSKSASSLSSIFAEITLQRF